MKTLNEFLDEATYKGKSVPLNKPMKGDVKKSKVYVDPDGDDKAKKVEFGDKNMSIKADSELSTRSRNAMETLYNHIEKETNQKGLNMFGLFSGVTSWTTHEKSAPRRENGREESIMTGTNYRTNEQGFEFALNKLGLVMA